MSRRPRQSPGRGARARRPGRPETAEAILDAAVTAIVASIRRDGAGPAAVADPLEAELFVSVILAMWHARTPQEAEPLEILANAVMRRLASQPDPDAIAALPGLAAIAPPPLEDATREAVARVRAAGTPEPVWSRSIGRPTLVDAWISTDELDDQSNVLAAFAYDHRPQHAINLIIDANFQGLIRSALVTDNPAKVRWEWARASGLPIRPLSEQVLADVLGNGIEMFDAYLDPPVSMEVGALMPLLRARLRLLPAPRPIDPPETTEEEREELVAEFAPSPEVAGLGLVGGNPSADLARWFVDFACDYGARDPLRWSPIAVEILLGDWLPRKALLEPDEIAILPEVLRRFVRFAAGRKGLAEPIFGETLEAADRFAPEFTEGDGRRRTGRTGEGDHARPPRVGDRPYGRVRGAAMDRRAQRGASQPAILTRPPAGNPRRENCAVSLSPKHRHPSQAHRRAVKCAPSIVSSSSAHYRARVGVVITKQGRGRPSRGYILAQVDVGMADLARAGGLPSADENSQIWRDIWFEEAHNSTAIEGNTLVLKEVRTLLNEGRPVGNKELCQYLDVQGYARAAEWVYGQATTADGWGRSGLISQTELREIHRLAVGLAWDVCPPDNPPLDPGEHAGSFRRHDIAPFLDGMTAPPWPEVDAHISGWLDSVNAGPAAGEHVLTYLARVHNGFERIHPFRDGNGRAGRLALNLLLVRNGHPPAVIRKRIRTQYLRAMRRADRDEFAPLAEILARAVKESLDRFLLPNLAGPARLLPLSALGRPGLTVRALRAAAEKGTLRARRDQSGRWLSSGRWVDEYRATRRVGRPIGRTSATRPESPPSARIPPEADMK